MYYIFGAGMGSDHFACRITEYEIVGMPHIFDFFVEFELIFKSM